MSSSETNSLKYPVASSHSNKRKKTKSKSNIKRSDSMKSFDSAASTMKLPETVRDLVYYCRRLVTNVKDNGQSQNIEYLLKDMRNAFTKILKIDNEVKDQLSSLEVSLEEQTRKTEEYKDLLHNLTNNIPQPEELKGTI